MNRGPVGWLAMALCVVGCAGDDSGDAGGGLATCEPAAAGEPGQGVVRIGARHHPDWGDRATVEGVIVAGSGWRFSDLAPQWQQETMREGDCALFEYQPSFCEEQCFGACVDGECRWPTMLSAGTMTVGGLGQPVVMEADSAGFWGDGYRAAIEPPPAGRLLSFCAAGDQAAGFLATVISVAPIEPPLSLAGPGQRVLVLEDGGDLTLSWTRSRETDVRVRLTLNTNNDAHGLPYPAIIECDAPDTGTLTVPQALIEAFPAVPPPPNGPLVCAGSDCPSSSLVRYRATKIERGGLTLELRAEHALEFVIAH